MKRILLVVCMTVGGSGCGQNESDAMGTTPWSSQEATAVDAAAAAEAEAAMEAQLTQVESALRSLPGLIGSVQRDMRRHLNAAHVAAAQRNGVGPVRDSTHVEALVRAGRLVRLPDSTQWWVTRELDYSLPYVTPGTQAALEEVGRRFHSRLESRGLPAIRLDVTSVLRTDELQARLRRSNRNAASSTSSHEFGTTLDIAYSAFAAPLEPIVPLETAEAPWLEPHLARFASAMAESVAARRSRELQAILGHVLLELQEEGRVMVTLERLQPVYHLTVAREQPAARGIAVGMASRVVRTGSSDDQKR
jgi:hypothetical protein